MPDPWEKYLKPPTSLGADIGGGELKALTGMGVTAAQLAQDVAPGTAAMVKKIPGVQSTMRQARDWAMSPGDFPETVGYDAMSALPFLFQPELAGPKIASTVRTAAPYFARAAQTIGDLSESALQGFEGGFAQPTKSGDIASHVGGGATGALEAETVRGAGKAFGYAEPAARYAAKHAAMGAPLSGLAWIAHQTGVPLQELAIAAAGGWYPLWRLIRNSPYAKAAGNLGGGSVQTIEKGSQVAAPVLGAEMGRQQAQ